MERLVHRVERAEILDRPAHVLDNVTKPAHSGQVGAVLRGEWLGHALHPLMTDLPLGCWLSAGLLDVVGGTGTRLARRRLVGLGILFAAPTMASGAAEWPSLMDNSTRRIAMLHVVGNLGVSVLYLVSWFRRREERHTAGVLWGFGGGLLALLTGYLGGHLSLGRGVGNGERWSRSARRHS